MHLSEAEWDHLLDEMIWAFEWRASEKSYGSSPAEKERVQAAFEAFGRYYTNLWI